MSGNKAKTNRRSDVRMTIENEPKIDYDYVPAHLAGRVRNWRSLSIGERLKLSFELSEAA